jgi:hypothetical protein
MRRVRDSHGMMTTVIRCHPDVMKRMKQKDLAHCLGQLAASIGSDGLPAGIQSSQLGGLCLSLGLASSPCMQLQGVDGLQSVLPASVPQLPIPICILQARTA